MKEQITLITEPENPVLLRAVHAQRVKETEEAFATMDLPVTLPERSANGEDDWEACRWKLRKHFGETGWECAAININAEMRMEIVRERRLALKLCEAYECATGNDASQMGPNAHPAVILAWIESCPTRLLERLVDQGTQTGRREWINRHIGMTLNPEDQHGGFVTPGGFIQHPERLFPQGRKLRDI